jgi:hypothetical protein
MTMTVANSSTMTVLCLVTIMVTSLMMIESSIAFTTTLLNPATTASRHQSATSSSSSSSLIAPPRRIVLHLAAGKGFGRQSDNKNSSPSPPQQRKSYGRDALTPIQGVMDMESAMSEFFVSRGEWHPLFRSLAVDPSVPAMTFLEVDNNSNDSNNDFEFHEDTRPWKRLQAVPTRDDDRAVLATFLDAMQQSLVDIPVDESTKEDENDLHFIEEGRRMLVCSRFHVIQNIEHGSIDSYDSLFSSCWNEIAELSMTNEVDTGSLIVVPGFEYDDLRQFTDMNLQRPLEWLGMHEIFEVASMERGGLSVVRLIHKLSDIPAGPPDDEDTS